ncbi:MAG: guanylate kinase [Candidatus Omnitrophota bacterium]
MTKAKPKGSAKLFIISAPSGCGKTTLCKKLLADDLGLAHSVSMTTRSPRPGEAEGTDYLFVSEKDFRGIAAKNGFLEREENFGFLYGTPRKFIEDSLNKNKSVLLSIDVKGAMKVRLAYPKESVLIFILPPSIGILKKRLRGRKSENTRSLSTRLGLAKKELSYKDRYDYKIVNDRLDSAYKQLKNVIISELKGE